MPSDASYDRTRRYLRRQLTESLRNDHEEWCIGECRELSKVAAIGSSGDRYQLIRYTGPRKLSVSEAVKESGVSPIHS